MTAVQIHLLLIRIPILGVLFGLLLLLYGAVKKTGEIKKAGDKNYQAAKFYITSGRWRIPFLGFPGAGLRFWGPLYGIRN